MYQIVKHEDHEYIEVGPFVVGEIFLVDDGTWHAVVNNKNNLVGMRFCSTNRKKAVEGLLKQMIYATYNDVLEDK